MIERPCPTCHGSGREPAAQGELAERKQAAPLAQLSAASRSVPAARSRRRSHRGVALRRPAAVFYLLRSAETDSEPATGRIVQPIVRSAPRPLHFMHQND